MLTCTEILISGNRAGKPCGKPATQRLELIGGDPVCGVHARSNAATGVPSSVIESCGARNADVYCELLKGHDGRHKAGRVWWAQIVRVDS